MKKFLYLMGIALMFLSSCGSDDDPKGGLSKTNYSVYAFEKEILQGSNLKDVVWNSSNEFSATVKNGVIQAAYVGNTTVSSLSGDMNLTIEVKPKSKFYEEPLLMWGVTKSAVKSCYGTPYQETSDIVLFKTDNNQVPTLGYGFSDGKVSGAFVFVSMGYAGVLGEFLAERYVLAESDSSKGTLTYLHCYGKIDNPQCDYGVVVHINVDENIIMVFYVPINNTKSDADFKMELESFKSSLSKILR